MQSILRWYLVLLILTVFLSPLCGAQQIPSVTILEGHPNFANFSDSVAIYIDESQSMNIRDIDSLASRLLTRGLLPDNLPDAPIVLWMALKIKNSDSVGRYQILNFCGNADSVWLYAFQNNNLIQNGLTGSRVHPSDKPIRAKYNYIPISLDPGAEKTYYIRLLFPKKVPAIHLKELYMLGNENTLSRLFGRYTWHAFYAGVMTLFCIFSLVIFALFRDRIFIYFAFLTLAFGLYFSYNNALLEALIVSPLKGSGFSLGHFIVSLIIISFFLIVSDYLSLKEKFKTFYWIYLAVTVLTAVLAQILGYFLTDGNLVLYIHNWVIAVWILFTIYPVVVMALRKDKAARILLGSIGLLFAGALFYVLSFQNISTSNPLIQNSFQLGTLLFSGVLFYSLFDRFNLIQAEKNRFEELDELKSRFFVNISHEFRTPLTLMMGPLQELLRRSRDPDEKALLTTAYDNGNRQLNLINQLLELSRLDAGKLGLEAEECDLATEVKGNVFSFESLAKEKGIALKVTGPDNPVSVYLDRDKFGKILYNLVSNAFKFTSRGGEVLIHMRKDKDSVIVTVSDTGSGISAEKLPYIFDRFFQGDSGLLKPGEGSGIGLALVKELVHLHHGKISVDSEPGHGTVFQVSIPLGTHHLKPGEIVSRSEHSFGLPGYVKSINSLADTPSIDEYATFAPGTEKNQVLIIEDNEDVRVFMRQRLSDKFMILEAADGESGIKSALDHLPDLIISDVMMPEKNGYEVCEILKSDIRTSHIPIILLTAKAGREDKLEGLHTGADDYLLKPFDSEELVMRVRNLILSRKVLQERFASAIYLKPSEISANSMDRTFLEKAISITEENLNVPGYGIDTLAKEIGISRANLNRKLRALTGQSTNQFIQSIRLQRAADLLRQRTATVAEIADQTGFSTPAYFIKCFKDHFGDTPGNFMKNV